MRTPLLSLLLWLAAAHPVARSADLTEAESLRRGLSRPEVQAALAAPVAVAEADASAAGLWPNPVLEYGRERTRGDATRVLEQSLTVSQNFDLSGRRGLAQAAAHERLAASLADGDSRRVELAADIRRAFFDLLLRQSRRAAVAEWAARLARVEGVVEQLARAGEASGYDRRRLTRERLSVEARQQAEAADLARAWAKLAGLIGAPPGTWQGAAGELAPSAPLPAFDVLQARLAARADLRALAARAQAHALSARAAAGGAVPDVTVGIGPKRIEDGPVRENGLLVSVSLPLPLFDRQQAGQARAGAEEQGARAELALARARAEGDLRGAFEQAQRLAALAGEFRLRSLPLSDELTGIAELAYRGGEGGILELLDAWRGALDAQLQALELASAARAARIDLDQISGVIPE